MAKRQQWTNDDDDEEELLSLHENDDLLADASIETKTFSFDTDFGTNRVIIAAQLGGYDRLAATDYENQDCFIMLKLPTNNDDCVLLMGVMDGHDKDGATIAGHVQQELPRRLTNKLESCASLQPNKDDETVVTALKESFREVHESLPGDVIGGSTVSVVLQWENKLYIANAGDSLTLVAVCDSNHGNVDIVFQTRIDRPDVEEERQRIEEMGGRVSACGRVMYQDSESDDSWKPGVAMSRGIGDREMIGVTPEPLVKVLDIKELLRGNDYIIVISASDGMTDCIPPLKVAMSIARAFSPLNNETNPSDAVKILVHQAATIWSQKTGGSYRDDITLVACQTLLLNS